MHSSTAQIDHLHLPDVDRRLISQATNGSDRVFLAPMDKGLSGSAVWQARWQLQEGNRLSALHVFKIGPRKKIEKEHKAMRDIAAAVSQMPNFEFFFDDSSDRALLRLAFQGDPDGESATFSLRNFIRQPNYRASGASIKKVIDNLYEVQLKNWHYQDVILVEKRLAIQNAFPKWRKKADLEKVARQIGRDALDKELVRHHNLRVRDLVEATDRAFSMERNLPWGAVHGDLHAQNVNLDKQRNVYVIDYGDTCFNWRALDFVILEATIKFAASPAHAPLRELLKCEALLEAGGKPNQIDETFLYGSGLKKVLEGCQRVRHHLRTTGAEPDFENYRAGLLCVAAAFTSIEWLVNRRFLFHSIAFHVQRMHK